MDGGKAEIVERRALLFYPKRRLGVVEGADKPPNAQQVIIMDDCSYCLKVFLLDYRMNIANPEKR
jgi:hypothetical protein